MTTPKGRIRKGGDKGFQGVSIVDNWRTEWFKNEETAQKHLDDHLESLGGKKARRGKKAEEAQPDGDEKNAENEFVEQGADDIAPGGQDTGPRG